MKCSLLSSITTVSLSSIARHNLVVVLVIITIRTRKETIPIALRSGVSHKTDRQALAQSATRSLSPLGLYIHHQSLTVTEGHGTVAEGYSKEIHMKNKEEKTVAIQPDGSVVVTKTYKEPTGVRRETITAPVNRRILSQTHT